MTDKLDELTSRFPLIGKWNFGARMLTCAGILLIPLTLLLYWAITPSDREIISDKTWCVTQVISGGTELHPNTQNGAVRIVINGCEEQMMFTTTTIKLPGFDSPSVSCRLLHDAAERACARLRDAYQELTHSGVADALTAAEAKMYLKDAASDIDAG
jgi:hypothetical protein